MQGLSLLTTSLVYSIEIELGRQTPVGVGLLIVIGLYTMKLLAY